MSNLLNIVCIALSICYVCAAPTSTLAPLEQIINQLITLRSVPMDNLHMKSLYPDLQKKNVSIEELSCRAKKSFEALEGNRTNELQHLHRFLKYFTKDVNCSMFTYEKHEVTEDVKTVLEQLLDQFRKYVISLEISKQ